MERRTILERLTWQLAQVVATQGETARVKSITLAVPNWKGHRPGQPVDIRLTAEDGYQAERSYSIASAPESRDLELAVERLDDGEVSPYLVDDTGPGDQFELRGPIGGWFVWHEGLAGPLVLVGGGSGLVPLMAMLRHRRAVRAHGDARLLPSARTIDDVLYRDELDMLRDTAAAIHITLTGGGEPAGWDGWTRRIDREMLAAVGPEPGAGARFYVCGPTPFVEEAARLLVALGHEPASIRTERFGPTG